MCKGALPDVCIGSDPVVQGVVWGEGRARTPGQEWKHCLCRPGPTDARAEVCGSVVPHCQSLHCVVEDSVAQPRVVRLGPGDVVAEVL